VRSHRELPASLLPGSALSPRNQWYVIAFSRRVGAQPLKRECLGDPIVLFRTDAGDPVALIDRCPHRGVPLSLGKRMGQQIQCGYHGFEYASDGACRRVPTSAAIPRGLRVHAYPLVERWEWIWMGDPALADAALIPDHSEIGLTAPGFFAEAGIVMEVRAN
jgi:phenylpropionate dioxygenase-like ring-hydroxylating dioxygenase large terminal subunit